jgi:hypothetical protein
MVMTTIPILLLSLTAFAHETTLDTESGDGWQVSTAIRCVGEVSQEVVRCSPIRGADSDSATVQPRWFNVEAEVAATEHDHDQGIFRVAIAIRNTTDVDLRSPDGSTPVGFRAFVVHSTMSFRSPDGWLSFAGAALPYTRYDEMVLPSAVSSPRLWEWHVPREVASFAFVIRIQARFRGDAVIPATPPTGWLIDEEELGILFAHENQIIRHTRMSGPYPRDLVLVRFPRDASVDERQAAVDYIDGRTVGGTGVEYIVQVRRREESDPLWWAVDRLRTLPQVRHAGPFLFALRSRQ